MAKVVQGLAGLGKNLALKSQKAAVYLQPKLATAARYAAVELRPPTPTEVGIAVGSAQKLFRSATSGAWAKSTVKEAWLNTLVTVEIVLWFFIGEIIGKGSIVGYNIPGAFHNEIHF